MPFKSKAQIAKFAEMVKQGKMSQETFNKWLDETTGTHKLPERVRKPTKIGKVKVIK